MTTSRFSPGIAPAGMLATYRPGPPQDGAMTCTSGWLAWNRCSRFTGSACDRLPLTSSSLGRAPVGHPLIVGPAAGHAPPWQVWTSSHCPDPLPDLSGEMPPDEPLSISVLRLWPQLQVADSVFEGFAGAVRVGCVPCRDPFGQVRMLALEPEHLAIPHSGHPSRRAGSGGVGFRHGSASPGRSCASSTESPGRAPSRSARSAAATRCRVTGFGCTSRCMRHPYSGIITHHSQSSPM